MWEEALELIEAGIPPRVGGASTKGCWLHPTLSSQGLYSNNTQSDLPLPICFFFASLAYDFFSVLGPLRHPALISFLLPFPWFSQRKYIDVAPGTDFEKRDDVQVGINVQNSHLSVI